MTPLFIKKIFRWPPLYPKIIEMTPPPPKKNEKTEKERKVEEKIKLLLLHINQKEVLSRFSPSHLHCDIRHTSQTSMVTINTKQTLPEVTN